MTDTEINRRLALAIGYTKKDVLVGPSGFVYVIRLHGPESQPAWLHFDYTDWRTIGPIMERYKIIPYWQVTSKIWGFYRQGWTYDKDLTTCAAMAVIEAHERGLLV